uniref:Gluconate 2-dehydrogenase subunit 3 family protein n=2 Tax=Aureimonas frigidaquae TaxID=424757 RepID=A0A0P0Z3Y4_9HYPH|nr:hypothetical protein [Aureimonas frigidaquae]
MSDRRNAPLSPPERARMMRALVDELIPGDAQWPSASEAGVHGLLALRVLADWDDAAVDTLDRLVGWSAGALSSPDAARREAAVASFEAASPKLFDHLRTATVLAYYETPFVIAAIQASGRPYSARPHLTGYPMAPFDFNRDTPRHGRGHYLTTDEVTRVDTTQLDLDAAVTQRWGLQR